MPIAIHLSNPGYLPGRLLDILGEDNIMWGSDFPHPDGLWPDSQAFIEKELGHLPDATRHKLVCGNAAKLYGFGA